jgi:hypothetical protein
MATPTRQRRRTAVSIPRKPSAMLDLRRKVTRTESSPPARRRTFAATRSRPRRKKKKTFTRRTLRRAIDRSVS